MQKVVSKTSQTRTVLLVSEIKGKYNLTWKQVANRVEKITGLKRSPDTYSRAMTNMTPEICEALKKTYGLNLKNKTYTYYKKGSSSVASVAKGSKTVVINM